MTSFSYKKFFLTFLGSYYVLLNILTTLILFKNFILLSLCIVLMHFPFLSHFEDIWSHLLRKMLVEYCPFLMFRVPIFPFFLLSTELWNFSSLGINRMVTMLVIVDHRYDGCVLSLSTSTSWFHLIDIMISCIHPQSYTTSLTLLLGNFLVTVLIDETINLIGIIYITIIFFSFGAPHTTLNYPSLVTYWDEAIFGFLRDFIARRSKLITSIYTPHHPHT